MGSNDILIVDDEIGIRELLSEILQDEGYRVVVAENAAQARLLRNQGRPALVLLDIWMPDTDGVTLLKEWGSNGQLTMPVVMMSGHATIDTAVEATRIGAFDFLEKPIGLQKLLATVKRALKHGEVQPKVAENSLAALGKSPLILILKKQLDQAQSLSFPLLLTGEPGSGFVACARYLTRPTAAFIAPDSQDAIVESGPDLVTKAANGTLFLRDIGHYERKAQNALVGLLPKLDKHNVRLICATSRSLPELIDRFDPALFTYLSQLVVPLPALREHRDDIPELAEHILASVVESNKIGPRRFTSSALNALRQHDWPGNHEQLHNIAKSLALTSTETEIDAAPVSRVLAQFSPPRAQMVAMSGPQFNFDQPLREARDEFERAYFDHHIGLEGGNMSRVADKVGLERTHLYRKLKQLGVQVIKRPRS
ncbi:sigma-54 dependent transcriptional regulator [Chitinimonas sp. BJYL2]|uniref:sigma-54-dependent transcriptional regulator n=1 Tax=Chitinimonas sp. BJYL2 TaxID=2976696 RepID=UPI0027E56319|nr:sigma-54 dependent transcriptional regulator [Chitinimonas sp. BJYL2]